MSVVEMLGSRRKGMGVVTDDVQIHCGSDSAVEKPL